MYHCLYGSISDGNSFGAPGETVNAREEVRKPREMVAVQQGQHELFGNELWERERMTVEIVYDVVSLRIGTAHKSMSNGERRN